MSEPQLLQPELPKELINALTNARVGDDHTPEELLSLLDEHMQKARDLAVDTVFVGEDTAKMTAGILRVLVERISDETPDEVAGWVRSAVHYFVITEDEEDDLVSAFGFDDDLQVAKAVAAMLTSRDDW